MSTTPMNMGIKEISCQEVGDVLKMIHTKRSVIKGPSEPNAFALVTGMRWIPSTHNMVESPKISTPFATKKGRECTTLDKGEAA